MNAKHRINGIKVTFKNLSKAMICSMLNFINSPWFYKDLDSYLDFHYKPMSLIFSYIGVYSIDYLIKSEFTLILLCTYLCLLPLIIIVKIINCCLQ